MHDRVRRQVCRLLFVLTCALPTGLFFLWTCVVHSPPYRAVRRAAWEEDLSEQLGVAVTLGSVRQPNRGLRLLEGLEFRDPETNRRIARIRLVEIRRIDDHWLLIASQPEVQGDQVLRLWEILHEHVLRAQWQEPLRAQIAANEVTVLQSEEETGTTLTSVRCQLQSTQDGPQATIEFRDVALQTELPVRIRATRDRRVSPPRTRFELDTQGTPLVCSLLAEQLPVLGTLGESAAFSGKVAATRTRNGWDADLSGQFTQVELDRVVTGRYPHKLSGLANVALRRATIREGQLVDAEGDIHSHGGVVSRSLLSQADLSLGLTADPRVHAVNDIPLWAYDELRFQFAVSEKGISIGGLCDGAVPGVVMADSRGPLLRDRPQEVAQVVALVQTLTSREGQQLPSTAEAYQLLHFFPVPSGTPHSAARAAAAYRPLRMQ